MRLVIDLVDDLQATILAARQVQDPTNRLARLFPVETTEDLRYRLLQRQRVDTAGAVRAFNTPSREIRRAGVIEVKGGLPAVSAITSFTESDLQKARQIARIPANGVELQNDVDSAAADVAIAIDNAYELLRGSVLTTGALQIDTGEVIQSADYGVPSTNKVVAQVPLTDPNAPFLDYLEAWQAAYIRNGKGQPGNLTTTQRSVSLIRRNNQVKAALATNANTNAVVTLDALNNYLTSEGLPAITADGINERVIDGQRVISEGSFVWTSDPAQGAFGNTLLGISEQGVQLAAAGVLEASNVPGVTIATLVQDYPVAKAVNGDSVGLPVVNVPESLFIARLF